MCLQLAEASMFTQVSAADACRSIKSGPAIEPFEGQLSSPSYGSIHFAAVPLTDRIQVSISALVYRLLMAGFA